MMLILYGILLEWELRWPFRMSTESIFPDVIIAGLLNTMMTLPLSTLLITVLLQLCGLLQSYPAVSGSSKAIQASIWQDVPGALTLPLSIFLLCISPTQKNHGHNGLSDDGLKLIINQSKYKNFHLDINKITDFHTYYASMTSSFHYRTG